LAGRLDDDVILVVVEKLLLLALPARPKSEGEDMICGQTSRYLYQKVKEPSDNKSVSPVITKALFQLWLMYGWREFCCEPILPSQRPKPDDSFVEKI
jgi:hypothetical protein